MTGTAVARPVASAGQLALGWTVVGRLWAQLAHDVNNHLASVLGNAELGALSGDPARMKRCLAAAGRGAAEMKSLFGALSELAASTGPFDPKRDTLTEVIRPVERFFERSFEKACIGFTCELSAVPAITVDRRKLSLALAGLVAWMLDALRGSGEVAGTGGDIRLVAELARSVADPESGILRIGLSATRTGQTGPVGAPGADSPEASWARLVAELHGGRLDLAAGETGTDIELTIAP